MVKSLQRGWVSSLKKWKFVMICWFWGFSYWLRRIPDQFGRLCTLIRLDHSLKLFHETIPWGVAAAVPTSLSHFYQILLFQICWTKIRVTKTAVPALAVARSDVELLLMFKWIESMSISSKLRSSLTQTQTHTLIFTLTPRQSPSTYTRTHIHTPFETPQCGA